MTLAPRPGRPSAEAAEALTEKLLDVASKRFLEHGYAATSLEAIAGEAGVAKHTLYRRFADKGALFAAVMARGARRIEALTATLAGETPLQRLKALGAAALERSCHPDSVRFLRMIIAEGPRFPELAQRFAEYGGVSLAGLAETLVREAQAAGELGPGDPTWLARNYLHIVSGLPLYRALTGSDEFASPQARQAQLERSWRLFLDGARLGVMPT